MYKKRSKYLFLEEQQPTWSSNTVEVSLSILGEIKINYHVDRLDINTSGEEIYREGLWL